MPNAYRGGGKTLTKAEIKAYIKKKKLEMIKHKEGETPDAQRAYAYTIQVLNDIERKVRG